MKTILLLCLALATINALYSSGSKVKVLDAKTFREKVQYGKEVWMIEFFAPWCGHCQQLVPEYEKAAKALDGIVNIGALDADANKDLAGQFGVKGFPTLKFFGENKSSPTDYNGERTGQAITDFVLNEIKKIATSRLSGGSGGSRSRDRDRKSGSSGSGSGSGGSGSGSGPATDKDVIILEDSNFDENVYKSKESWFVEFYAPWCGHCKKLEPEWNKVASELKGEIKVAKVDATAQTKLASRFGVSGYPTLKFFPAGLTSDSEVIDYGGGRDASSLISWAKEQGEKFKPLPIQQLTRQSNFEEYCTNFNGVCVIVFLPHIYDSNKRERNDYLKILEDGASMNKGKPLSYLWAQGGDYFEFEETFQCGSAYPSILAMSIKKNVYAKLKGVFNKENFDRFKKQLFQIIDRFLKNLLTGRESFIQIQGLPTLKNVQPWDGQDHKPETSYDDDL